MAHVYILRCADGSYYVGSTRNLGARLHHRKRMTSARAQAGALSPDVLPFD